MSTQITYSYRSFDLYDFQNMLTNFISEIEKLENENEELRDRVDELETEKEDLEARIIELENQLEE